MFDIAAVKEKLYKNMVQEYGEIAMKLRRGMLDEEEANYFWNESEKKHQSLLNLIKSAENDTCLKVILTGIMAS